MISMTELKVELSYSALPLIHVDLHIKTTYTIRIAAPTLHGSSFHALV